MLSRSPQESVSCSKKRLTKAANVPRSPTGYVSLRGHSTPYKNRSRLSQPPHGGMN